jgi:hypothetical protein
MRQHDAVKAMAGGLLGTLLQTIVVYGVAPIMAGQSIDVAAMLGHACASGMLPHLLSGSVIFPLGYLVLSSRSLSGPPVLQGMLWGGLLWFVAEFIMAPMLGAEVFSTALGGLPAALRALLGYLVYGATLGGVVGVVQPEDSYASQTLIGFRSSPEN